MLSNDERFQKGLFIHWVLDKAFVNFYTSANLILIVIFKPTTTMEKHQAFGNIFNPSQGVQAGVYCEKDRCERYACGFLWLSDCGSCVPNGSHTTNCNSTSSNQCETLGCGK